MKNLYDYDRFLTRLRNANKEGRLFEIALEETGTEETPVFSYAIQRPEGWKTDWNVLSGWVDFWNEVPCAKDGHPLYTIRWANAMCGSFGKQRVPTHVDVWRASDGLALLDLTQDMTVFTEQKHQILEACPQISGWHTKYFSRIQKEALYPACLAIAGAFLEGKGKNQYKREIKAAGVDTKFIERHGFLIRTLWNALFPERTAESIEALSEKLLWKEETTGNVYVRFLDPSLSFYGARQCFMAAEDLADFRPPVKRVYIVENKVNGYTFPDVPESLILAGAGYGILEVARKAAWLKDIPIYYWGDMDSDGLYILSKLRDILPRTVSMLMDMETFSAMSSQTVRDDGGQSAVPACLTVSEKFLWSHLVEKHARIEQERIPVELVKHAIEHVLKNEK